MLTATHPRVDGEVAPAHAYLEHYPEQGGAAERVVVSVLPFTVGRADSNHQRIYANAVSKHHAVFVPRGDCCALRDLGSTNGTFVNGIRITEEVLNDGDIVHFGPVEFCFRAPSTAAGCPDVAAVGATLAMPRGAPPSMIRGAQRLRELIDMEAAEIVYQPIVDLWTRQTHGYEALARGRHPSLPSSPGGLFQLAEECGMAIELSQLLRRLAVVSARQLPSKAKLFLNIHPRELSDNGFIHALKSLRTLPCEQTLVLEIAEASVTSVVAMRQIRDAFAKLGFEFAYDDFGAGQARLLELTDIPPHYLKLDMGVIRGIEELRPRQEVVRALLSVVRTLGVQVIAEGVETEECASTCLELGCHLGQGFLFGRPAPPPQ